MLGREWAGGLASLANCHKKTGFPYKITNHLDNSGKQREKKKETRVCFSICMQIYCSVIQIIKNAWTCLVLNLGKQKEYNN